MQIYLAPLQGLTDWIFRESFSKNIGTFDKTFTPFVRVQNGDFYRPSQSNDLLPVHNTFQNPVPQFLGNEVVSFKRFEELCIENGYTEVNINMGCPYPMVTGKKMGAGILQHPEMMHHLLNGIFTNTKLKISVKCRLGLENQKEFEKIIPIFNDFPLDEIIIHPRIGKQHYKGEVDLNSFASYASQLKHSVCYNGDILNIDDVTRIQNVVPQIDRFMIGRGMLENPFLLAEIRRLEISSLEKKRMLRNFHLSVIEYCKQKYSGDLHMLKRLEEMWEYQAEAFENGRRIFKQIKKCKTMDQYEILVIKTISDMG
jgi:tRNA-dihydrouridine synthase